MKNLKLLSFVLFLVLPYTLDAKDLPMRRGYRQLKLKEFPKNRNGSLATFIYSEASASNENFLKKLNNNQNLMIEAIRDSLKMGRVPMANSIWKRFVKSLNNSSSPIDINNVIFWAINEAYLGKKPKLTYRATLYKILNDKVNILEAERDIFKQIEKDCDNNSECSYDTKDEIERTNDLWKRRTKIFEKETKRAEKNFKNTFDADDGHGRLVQQVGILFFQSAEAIVSED